MGVLSLETGVRSLEERGQPAGAVFGSRLQPTDSGRQLESGDWNPETGGFGPGRWRPFRSDLQTTAYSLQTQDDWEGRSAELREGQSACAISLRPMLLI